MLLSKTNKTEPPKIGGFIIFVIIISFIIITNNLNIYANYLFASFSLIVFGFIDDLYDLRPIQKLFGQSFIITSFVLLNYNYSNFIYLLLLIVIYISFLNSSNLIDGLDGLLCSLSTVTLYFIYSYNSNIIILILIISILIVLIFNSPNAKIYLGENGSIIIGFNLIYFCTNDSDMFRINDIINIAILYPIPLIDTIYTILRRFINKKNIFEKDQSHLHHILYEYFESKWITLIVLIITHITLINLFKIVVQ